MESVNSRLRSMNKKRSVFPNIEKSSEKLNSQIPQHSVYKMILRNKYHLSIHDCNDFLESCNLEKIIFKKKLKKQKKKIDSM